jgi:hypothetical protein
MAGVRVISSCDSAECKLRRTLLAFTLLFAISVVANGVCLTYVCYQKRCCRSWCVRAACDARPRARRVRVLWVRDLTKHTVSHFVGVATRLCRRCACSGKHGSAFAARQSAGPIRCERCRRQWDVRFKWSFMVRQCVNDVRRRASISRDESNVHPTALFVCACAACRSASG